MMSGLFIVNFQVPPSARYIYGGILKISPTLYLSGYCLRALMYLYLIFFTRYVRVRPSCLIILPIVRTGTIRPSFASLQCNFWAQSCVFFRFAITLSFTQIGVSFGLVFGMVTFGSKVSSPPLLSAESHLSRLRLLCGHTLATSTNRISPLTIGNTHLNLSSLIVCAIYIAISPF